MPPGASRPDAAADRDPRRRWPFHRHHGGNRSAVRGPRALRGIRNAVWRLSDRGGGGPGRVRRVHGRGLHPRPTLARTPRRTVCPRHFGRRWQDRERRGLVLAEGRRCGPRHDRGERELRRRPDVRSASLRFQHQRLQLDVPAGRPLGCRRVPHGSRHDRGHRAESSADGARKAPLHTGRTRSPSPRAGAPGLCPTDVPIRLRAGPKPPDRAAPPHAGRGSGARGPPPRSAMDRALALVGILRRPGPVLRQACVEAAQRPASRCAPDHPARRAPRIRRGVLGRAPALPHRSNAEGPDGPGGTRMRIAHVGVEIVPAENGAFVGGLVKHVATVSAAQVRYGHDVHVVTSDVRGRFTEDQPTPYGRVHRVPTTVTYGSAVFATTFLARAGRTVRRLHRAFPFDLIHVHSAYASLGAIRYTLGRLGIPMVFSLYSPNFRARPGHDCNGSRALGRRRIARRALRAFDRTIVPSENLRSRVVELGIPDETVSQILPALDPALLGSLPTREDARRRLRLPERAPVILFVGNYSPWKGVESLLHAMPDIRTSNPYAILVTAWGEPYEWDGNRRDDVLSLIQRLGLDPAVRQVGIVPDVETLLRAADLLVSPFECTCKVLDYPLSILEAMACERPVISTNVGGIPELLRGGERGILVEPRDTAALVRGIRALLEDPSRAQAIGRSGARWVRDRAGPETVLASVMSMYGEVGA